MSTVKSTEGRIFNFSIVESALMVCMAGLQVFIVRFFFQGARKGESTIRQRAASIPVNTTNLQHQVMSSACKHIEVLMERNRLFPELCQSNYGTEMSIHTAVSR